MCEELLSSTVSSHALTYYTCFYCCEFHWSCQLTDQLKAIDNIDCCNPHKVCSEWCQSTDFHPYPGSRKRWSLTAVQWWPATFEPKIQPVQLQHAVCMKWWRPADHDRSGCNILHRYFDILWSTWRYTKNGKMKLYLKTDTLEFSLPVCFVSK